MNESNLIKCDANIKIFLKSLLKTFQWTMKDIFPTKWKFHLHSIKFCLHLFLSFFIRFFFLNRLLFLFKLNIDCYGICCQMLSQTTLESLKFFTFQLYFKNCKLIDWLKMVGSSRCCWKAVLWIIIMKQKGKKKTTFPAVSWRKICSCQNTITLDFYFVFSSSHNSFLRIGSLIPLYD